MAGLFLIFSSALLAIFSFKRKLAITILCVGLMLTILMFAYHATSALKINW